VDQAWGQPPPLDAPAIQVAPTEDGHGATVGFNLAAVRQYGVLTVIKENPWKSTLLTAATGYGGYWIYQNYIDDDDRPPRPVGASGTASIGADGSVSATFDNVTDYVAIERQRAAAPDGSKTERVVLRFEQSEK
jgi:hypothetical protein